VGQGRTVWRGTGGAPGGVEAGHEEGGQGERMRGSEELVGPAPHDVERAQLRTLARTPPLHKQPPNRRCHRRGSVI
jgi:hypothetical protein